MPANIRDVKDVGSIPGSGRSPGGGHGNPLQDSFFFFFLHLSGKIHGPRSLVGYIVHEIAKSWT